MKKFTISIIAVVVVLFLAWFVIVPPIVKHQEAKKDTINFAQKEIEQKQFLNHAIDTNIEHEMFATVGGDTFKTFYRFKGNTEKGYKVKYLGKELVGKE